MILKKIIQWSPKTFPFFKKGETILIGHRGAPILAYENTIESFKKAFDTDLMGIELDLQLTKDKKLIIFHDWKIVTKNGLQKKISLLNYSDILSNNKNIKIPLLNNLINILPQNKFLNIEIKSMKIFNFELEKKLLNLLYDKKILNRVIISSFNPFALYKIKKMNPNIFTAFIWTNNHSPLLINTPLWAWFCKPDGFHIDYNYLNKKIIKWIKRKKMTILSYTINNKKDYIIAKKLNINGVFTDNPYLIK